MPIAQHLITNRNIQWKAAIAVVGASLFVLPGCAGVTTYDAEPYSYGPYYGYGYPYHGYSYYSGPGWYSYRNPGYPGYPRHGAAPPARQYEESERPAIVPHQHAPPSVRKRDPVREDAHRQDRYPRSAPPRRHSEHGDAAGNNHATPVHRERSDDRAPRHQSGHERRPTRHNEDKGQNDPDNHDR